MASNSFVTGGGPFYWVVPAHVSSAMIEAWGGGGGGASNNRAGNNGGGAGGGGGYSRSNMAVSAGTNYTIYVGNGGVGGTNNNNGTNGTNSNFNGTTVVARFGIRGLRTGTGGAVSGLGTGNVTYQGGAGAPRTAGNYSGGGGAGAGNAANGNSSTTFSGAIGGGGGGSGGNGSATANLNGEDGFSYGGGGGGAAQGTSNTKHGGNGSTGAVIITYELDPHYHVTYSGNGNTGGYVPIDDKEYWPGDTVTVSGNPGNLTLAGYLYGGWSPTAS